jgi:KRAB domain-containing zinc finger protein
MSCLKNFRTERISSEEKPYTGEKLCSFLLCSETFKEKTGLRAINKCIVDRSHSVFHSALKPLQENMHIHTGIKSFLCTQFNKSFYTFESLRGHEKVHCEEKQYTFEQCSKSFSSMSYLQVHMEAQAAGKPFSCDHCSNFLLPLFLRLYLKLHTVEKPYSCTNCEKIVTQSNTSRRHKRFHTGEKP